MNKRPNVNDFVIQTSETTFEMNLDEYYDALEKYCDNLEKRINELEEDYDELNKYYKELEDTHLKLKYEYDMALSDVVKYTMALDKVSNELAYLQSKLYESIQSKIYEFEKTLYRLGYDNYDIPLDIKPRTADDVKAWALRGVKR